MTKDREKKTYSDMDDVVETSKKIRGYLLDETVSQEDKQDHFEFFKQALIANKNIVSATGLILSVERLTGRTYKDEK